MRPLFIGHWLYIVWQPIIWQHIVWCPIACTSFGSSGWRTLSSPSFVHLFTVLVPLIHIYWCKYFPFGNQWMHDRQIELCDSVRTSAENNTLRQCYLNIPAMTNRQPVNYRWTGIKLCRLFSVYLSENSRFENFPNRPKRFSVVK